MSTAILTDLSLRLRANTAELQQGLERAKANIKNFRKDTRDATNQIKGAFSDLGGAVSEGLSRIGGGFSAMTGAIGGALKSVKGLTAGMNGLTKAVIASGIGAIFVAVGVALAGIISYFKGSVDGAGKLASVMGVLKGIFEVFKDILIGVGRFLVSMFENPKQAVADLWEAIKTNLANRFEGLVQVFVKGWQVIANGAKGVGFAIAGIFNEEKREQSKKYFDDMKTRLVDMGKAAFQVATGMNFDEAAQKAKEKFQEVSAEIKAIQELNVRRHKFELSEIEDITNEARLLRDIANQREIAGDAALTIAERQEAANKALALNEEYYAGEIGDAKELLAIKQRENQLTEVSMEDLKEEKELEAKVLELEEERAKTTKKIKNDIERAIREQAAEEKRALEEQKKAEEEAGKAKLAEEKRIADSIAAYREKKLSETLEGELMLLADRYQKGEIFEEEYRGERLRILEEIAKRNRELTAEEIKLAEEAKQKKIETVTGYMEAALQATEAVSMMFEAAKNKELQTAGDNEEKKAAIEKKYAKKQKSLAIIQAIINTALGITKAIGQGGILGFITGALVAAAGAAQIAVIASQPLAKGGIAYSPVNALVGEYPGAARNPEVIAPLDKLKGIIQGGNQDSGERVVRWEIEGYKLVGILEKQMKLNGAF